MEEKNGLFRSLLRDIRGHALWYLISLIFGSSVMTALLAWLRAKSDTPVTAEGAVVIFSVSLVIVAACIAVYFANKRFKKTENIEPVQVPKGNAWVIPLISVIVLLLIIWNVRLQSRVNSFEQNMPQRLKRLETEMFRYVLPRQLTPEQSKAFSEYLLSHSEPHEVTIRYVIGDTESASYAAQIGTALTAGNWYANMAPVSPASIVCHTNPVPELMCASDLDKMRVFEGVDILQTGPLSEGKPPATLLEKIHPPPLVFSVLYDAVKAAGIQETITGGYSLNGDPPNTITIFVGRRPRDKHAVLPLKNIQQWRRNPAIALEDDDF